MQFKKALKVFKSLNDLVPEYSGFLIRRSDTTPYTFRDSVNKLTIPLHCHAQIIVEIVSATVVLFFGIVFLNPIQIGWGSFFRSPFAKKFNNFKTVQARTTKHSGLFLKFICEHFDVAVTSTSILMLPWQPSFDSHVFRNLHFLYKIGVSSIFIDWIIT